MSTQIDPLNLPHILEAVVTDAVKDRSTALALRSTSRDVQLAVDRKLVHHIRVRPCGSLQERTKDEMTPEAFQQIHLSRLGPPGDREAFHQCSKHTDTNVIRASIDEDNDDFQHLQGCCLELLTPDTLQRLPIRVTGWNDLPASSLATEAFTQDQAVNVFNNTVVIDFGRKTSVPKEFRLAEFTRLKIVRGLSLFHLPFPKMAATCVEIMPFNMPQLEHWHMWATNLTDRIAMPNKAEKVVINAVINMQFMPTLYPYTLLKNYQQSPVKKVVIAFHEMEGHMFQPELPDQWPRSIWPYSTLAPFAPHDEVRGPAFDLWRAPSLRAVFHTMMDLYDLLWVVYWETKVVKPFNEFDDRLELYSSTLDELAEWQYVPRLFTVLGYLMANVHILCKTKTIEVVLVSCNDIEDMYLNAFANKVSGNNAFRFSDNLKVMTHEEYRLETGEELTDLEILRPDALRKYKF